MPHLHHVGGAHAVDVGDGDGQEDVAPEFDGLGAGVEVARAVDVGEADCCWVAVEGEFVDGD